MGYPPALKIFLGVMSEGGRWSVGVPAPLPPSKSYYSRSSNNTSNNSNNNSNSSNIDHKNKKLARTRRILGPMLECP